MAADSDIIVNPFVTSAMPDVGPDETKFVQEGVTVFINARYGPEDLLLCLQRYNFSRRVMCKKIVLQARTGIGQAYVNNTKNYLESAG